MVYSHASHAHLTRSTSTYQNYIDESHSFSSVQTRPLAAFEASVRRVHPVVKLSVVVAGEPQVDLGLDVGLTQVAHILT